ncbi:MAG: metallophosphoesterase [Thermomicrobiaceae bacterium]
MPDITRKTTCRLEMPLRAMVTGDTHLNQRRDWLPRILVDAMIGADLILHTGDICTVSSKALFDAHGPVLAVAGNNEDDQLANSLPDRITLDVGGRSIILIHGHLEPGSSARTAVQKSYAGHSDIVIYGHSHKPQWEEVTGTWFLNPGSPTYKRRELQFSFAILTIAEDGEIDVKFTLFDEQI